jgi:hypothetical protein
MVKKTILSKTCFSNTSIIIIILLIIIIIGLCYFLFDKKQDSSPVNQYNIQNSNPSEDLLHVRPNYGYTNLPNDILMNPYTAPLKDDRYLVTSSDIRGAVPINVRTQGVDTNYRQLGILTRVNKNDKKETILALLGRPLITNRCKWQYYTMETKNNIKLPIISNGRSCTNEQGCDELYENDIVYVEGYNEPFKITMYDNNTMKYLPFI